MIEVVSVVALHIKKAAIGSTLAQVHTLLDTQRWSWRRTREPKIQYIEACDLRPVLCEIWHKHT